MWLWGNFLRYVNSLMLSGVLGIIIYQMVTEARARGGTIGRAGEWHIPSKAELQGMLVMTSEQSLCSFPGD